MIHQPSKPAIARPRSLSLPSTAIVLSLVAFSGCGTPDDLNRQAITGTVTLDGQPMPRGAILFEPASEHSGTAVGATIRSGDFTIAKRDGPVPGRYRVRVYASSGVQAPPAKGQTERTPRPMVERLPARYNTQSELGVEVVVRAVNRFRFDLNSGESSEFR